MSLKLILRAKIDLTGWKNFHSKPNIRNYTNELFAAELMKKI